TTSARGPAIGRRVGTMPRHGAEFFGSTSATGHRVRAEELCLARGATGWHRRHDQHYGANRAGPAKVRPRPDRGVAIEPRASPPATRAFVEPAAGGAEGNRRPAGGPRRRDSNRRAGLRGVDGAV